jgi:GT2 family glycosyltransferase
MDKQTAVILINWNSFECTRDCIESLKSMPYNDYDVILVDNHSQDESGDKLAAAYPELIYLKLPENLGFTGGNNAGINYSLDHNYRYTVLLNNDTFVEPDFLEILVRYLAEHPGTGAIQPKIYFNHNRDLLWNGGSWFNPWTGNDYVEGTGKTSSKTSESLKEPDWLTGCALMIRNDVIKKIGLLDELLFMYYEDVDYSFRIKRAGYSLIYHPESVVYHIAGASTRANEKGKEGFLNPIVHYYLVRNRIWLLKKYLRPRHKITAGFLVSVYLIGALAYFIIRRRFVKLKTVMKAIRDGLKGNMTLDYRINNTI